MSIASQPGHRPDAIEVYLGHQGDGTLSLALSPSRLADSGTGTGSALQRATSSLLRGGLTGWVHIGMLVRRLRGRADPLVGLGQRDTFLALCRLTQTAVEARPVVGDFTGGVTVQSHVRLFTTPFGADEAVERVQRVLRPYAAAGTVTRSGHAVIAWFAIRHLIETRSRDYSLQVVYLSAAGDADGQVSLMLPRDPAEAAHDLSAAVAAVAAGDGPPDEGGRLSGGAAGSPGTAARSRTRRLRRARRPSGAPRSSPADLPALQAYLDAYREHLTRELLLEPVVSNGSAADFAWAPEPTGDGGVAVAGTVPASVTDRAVLRMAEHAVAQLGERSPHTAGVRLGDPEPDGELLVQRWAVGEKGGYLLSVAARSGDGRRPTQVVLHFAPDDGQGRELTHDPTPTPPGGSAPALPAPPHEPPRTGAAVDEARGLTVLPLWWHSADARCDGNDVILYEMPFRGQRLRIRANDYPAEPMYTLLVGDPGAEVAAVDLEHWPSPWVRPRTF